MLASFARLHSLANGITSFHPRALIYRPNTTPTDSHPQLPHTMLVHQSHSAMAMRAGSRRSAGLAACLRGSPSKPRAPLLASRASPCNRRAFLAMRTHAVAGASMADSVRDYDGGYGVGSSSGSGPSTAARTPTVEELMADLTPEERLTVAMFQDHHNSVVNISTSVGVLRPFSFDMMQLPRGEGSGFVWDSDGHVITNSHVVEAASQVTVTLSDGTNAKATIKGRDRERDVAVLKLDLPADKLANLKPVRIGSSSNLLVGQKVYALGNPFGLDLSLTQGIVSGLGREIGSRRSPITNVIQTDAAINPGNSGGPLLDSKGRLVGINTAIIDPSGAGGFSGVGFAIPIDSAKGIVEQILQHGRVIRPALGISIASLPFARGSAREGVLVVNVRPGGPADVAGIQPTRREMWGRVVLGDVIVAINNKPVKKQSDLFAALDTARVGQAVEVTLAPRSGERWGAGGGAHNGDGRTRTVKVVLADREKMQWGSE